MSEVHRYQVVQMLTEDGNKISYSPTGPWVVMASEFDSMQTCFDAQRLRADTAEADLKRLDNLDTMQLIAELTKRNAAAEQRISDTVAKLQLAADMLDDDERGNRFAQVLQLAIAALNQKSEGESQ